MLDRDLARPLRQPGSGRRVTAKGERLTLPSLDALTDRDLAVKVERGCAGLIRALDEHQLAARSPVGARATHDRHSLAPRRRVTELRRDLALAEQEGEHAARLRR